MLRIAALLLVAVVVIDAKLKPRAEYQTDDEFEILTGRPGAFDHCWSKKHQHIAHVGQVLLDHKEKRAKHTNCGWTYDRQGPFRVWCEDDDKDDDGWCENPLKELCEGKANDTFGVYCNTGKLPEHWEYNDGEMAQAVMFEGKGVVHHIGAAKALCEERGMTLAYSNQIAVQSTRYNFTTNCQHCFLRKTHAVYSANCGEDHEFDYWIQDTADTYCYICYGVPDMKYEHPCKKAYPVYGGKPIECVKDKNGKKNGNIIIQNRVDCSIELDSANDQERFSGKQFHHYRNGFRSPGEELTTYWLGLQLQHIMTQNIRFGLRIDLTGRDGTKKFIEYETFTVGIENKDDRQTKRQYVMTVGPPMKGSTLPDQLHINQKSNLHTISGSSFSCPPHDNDRNLPSSVATSVNCAEMLGNTCWWFNLCDTLSNLNGLCDGEDQYDAAKKVARIWGSDPNFLDFRESTMSLVFKQEDYPDFDDWVFDFEDDD